MSDELEARAQATQLRKQFKRTNVQPEEWVPPPTAGDTAREVTAELEGLRADQIERAEHTARSLWAATKGTR